MAGAEDARPPLPAEPHECRRAAQTALVRADTDRGPLHAIAWALLAVAGELGAIRRELHKRGR